ncbi:MAG: sulfite exporter TauE/SafE family protein [Cyanobacteria bacterium P01_H01_bin.74]
MTIPLALAYAVVGLFAGILSGVVGIGGGIVIVPALVYLFQFSQQMAQGTTIALLVLPIGILGALEYYKSGFVDLKVAGIICLGFFIGSFFGAKIAIFLPAETLKKIFGALTIIVGVKMLLTK